MERITGIGGVFLRARDPAALAAWYAAHLGIAVEEWNGAVLRWSGGETTVWSAFPSDTTYFGRPEQQAMVNYRVGDLDAMVAQLRAAGVAVEDPQETENGRFAWATDPEGNRFELLGNRRGENERSRRVSRGARGAEARHARGVAADDPRDRP